MFRRERERRYRPSIGRHVVGFVKIEQARREFPKVFREIIAPVTIVAPVLPDHLRGDEFLIPAVGQRVIQAGEAEEIVVPICDNEMRHVSSPDVWDDYARNRVGRQLGKRKGVLFFRRRLEAPAAKKIASPLFRALTPHALAFNMRGMRQDIIELRNAVRAFQEATGLSPHRVGILIANNGRLVERLADGRRLWPETVQAAWGKLRAEAERREIELPGAQ